MDWENVNHTHPVWKLYYMLYNAADRGTKKAMREKFIECKKDAVEAFTVVEFNEIPLCRTGYAIVQRSDPLPLHFGDTTKRRSPDETQRQEISRMKDILGGMGGAYSTRHKDFEDMELKTQKRKAHAAFNALWALANSAQCPTTPEDVHNNENVIQLIKLDARDREICTSNDCSPCSGQTDGS